MGFTGYVVPQQGLRRATRCQRPQPGAVGLLEFRPPCPRHDRTLSPSSSPKEYTHWISNPEFPAHRLADPQRRGDLAVHLPGVGGLRRLRHRPVRGPARDCREVDFAIWFLDCARISMEVKAGPYRIVRGRWYLDGPNGGLEVSSQRGRPGMRP